MQVAEGIWEAAGIKFFQKAEVVDPDDAFNVYVFDLDDSTHCACFNIGEQLTWAAIVHWMPPYTIFNHAIHAAAC